MPLKESFKGMLSKTTVSPTPQPAGWLQFKRQKITNITRSNRVSYIVEMWHRLVALGSRVALLYKVRHRNLTIQASKVVQQVKVLAMQT